MVSSPFIVDKLLPGESLSEEIPFLIEDEIGDSLLVVRLFFDDVNGTHVIEHSSPLIVDNTGAMLLVFIAGVLLLVILYFQLRKMKQSGEYEERFSGEEKEGH